MLYSQDFLKQLDSQKNRITYVRITALRFDESPIESIEGRATGGSINVDGSSAVRRTCSVSFVADNYNYNNYIWGLNTKFKLEIGLKNNIDINEPDIIWFSQGIYLITSFNASRSTNNFSISISGKDKMCLLNGEVSGSLESQVDFGIIEEEDKNGIWTKRKIPIREIIINAVHSYGGEPIHNIIINDLPEYGLELLEYRYDLPMYLYRTGVNNGQNILWNSTYTNALINGEKLCRVGEPRSMDVRPLKELTNNELELLVDSLIGVTNPALIYFDDDEETAYRLAKIEYGQTAGYRETPLTYAGELIANVGESLTSILDKIKNMLGEFEYFYDIDGRFIFQRKRTFVNAPWTLQGVESDGVGDDIISSMMELSATAYTLNDNELITAFNNSYNLLNVRNDYSIWGERTGISGSAMAVHLRYAIDDKPTRYHRISVDDNDPNLIAYNKKYGTTLKGTKDIEEKYMCFESVDYDQNDAHDQDNIYDWREIIYQMALDYYRYSWMDDFELRVIEANKVDVPDGQGGIMRVSLYPTGRTGYEQYYIDLQGFWRQLYYPTQLLNQEAAAHEEKMQNVNDSIEYWQGSIPSLESSIDDAIAKLNNEDTTQENYNNLLQAKARLEIAQEQLNYYEDLKQSLLDKQKYYEEAKEKYYRNTNDPLKEGWNKDVFERPDQLNFWFDFLDNNGELANFSVKLIGDRLKSINDNNIKAIYFKETPSVIFDDNVVEDNISGYRVIQIPKDYMDTMFSISAQGKAAKMKLDEMINQYGYSIESATITTVPIYHLDTNTRIYLHDEETSLNGDYIISKISLPLTYNGTMSITATKAPQNLLY